MGSLLFVAFARLGHVEDKVLQCACLRHLPVNARWDKWLIMLIGGEWHVGHVEDEVANLTEELVLVNVPILAIASGDVGVRVEQGNPNELVAALDGRRIDGITDELRVVELYDRTADLVCTGLFLVSGFFEQDGTGCWYGQGSKRLRPEQRYCHTSCHTGHRLVQLR